MEMIEKLEYALVLAEGLLVSSEVDDMARQSICFYLKSALRELYDERNRMLDKVEKGELDE